MLLRRGEYLFKFTKFIYIRYNMRIRNVLKTDLNLLKVFYALIAERHLTRAGAQIGMSQPGMSHALRRLREIFGDELFVRTTNGLEPTVLAERLADPVKQLLEEFEQTLVLQTGFDPALSTRTFRLGMNDYVASFLLPRLVKKIRPKAPDVTLRSVHIPSAQSGRGGGPTADTFLDSDAIDIAVIRPFKAPARFEVEDLLTADGSVCLAASDNPRIKTPLDLSTFTALGHVMVSTVGREQGWIDKLLKEKGLERRVVVSATHFDAAIKIVAETDLITTLPLGVLRTLGCPDNVKTYEPPFPSRLHRVSQVWMGKYNSDPAHAWLRACIRSCFADA